MRAAIIVLLMAGCVTGPPRQRGRATPVECTTSYAAPVAHTVLAAAMAVGAVALIQSVRNSDDPEACGGICPLFLAQLIVAAPIFAIYAAHSYAQVHACRETAAEIRVEVAEDEAEAAAGQHQRDVRERAWRLTVAAQADARAANCDAVRTSSAAVLALDAEFHSSVFVRDVAIARCLAPPR
jgi:hypothetical protein